MEVMYWLIPVALCLLAVAIAAFVWAVKSDQYSDLDSPAYKILFDDDSDPLNANSVEKHHSSSKQASAEVTADKNHHDQ